MAFHAGIKCKACVLRPALSRLRLCRLTFAPGAPDARIPLAPSSPLGADQPGAVDVDAITGHQHRQRRITHPGRRVRCDVSTGAMDRAGVSAGGHHVDCQRRASGRCVRAAAIAADRHWHFYQCVVVLRTGSGAWLVDRRAGRAGPGRGNHVRLDRGAGGGCGAQNAGGQCDGPARDDVGHRYQPRAVTGWSADRAGWLAVDLCPQRALGPAQRVAGLSLSAGGSADAGGCCV